MTNRDETIELITRYFNALKSSDFSNIQFSPDVTHFTPFMETPITGMEEVVTSLKETSKIIEDINILRLVIENEFACAFIEFKNKDGIVVEMCDTYRISDGKFVEMRPYFDPRPLIGE
jgi:limonene-1,2-epoxide hydrolase